MTDSLLTIREVADILRVSVRTLERQDNAGKLLAVKTVGGHRRYKQEDIDNFLGNETEELEKTVCIYGRVSSHDQKKKGDLDRQCQRLSEHCVKKKYKVGHILKDVGSGLSDLRRGFNKLAELVIAGKVSVLVIEHKDRLTRFQFNILEKFFNSYGVTIECIDKPDKDSEEEFINDIMMLMASFSGKLYGRRSAKNRREKALREEKIKESQ